MADRTVAPASPPVPDAAARARRAAWWSLALYPITFVAAFVVGEGLAELLGHDTDSQTAAPLRVALLAGGTAMLLFVIPGVLASHFGRRAMRLGEPRGLVPFVVGATIAVGFVGLNLVSYLARMLFE